MRILFQGLVCHTTIVVGGKTQQIAVLPADAAHKATLSFRRSDMIPKPTTTGSMCKDLLGCIDTNLGRGAAGVVDIVHVPHLTDTTTGTAADASPELVKCPPSSATIRSIFFLPPGGRLFRDFYFAHEVEFNGVNHGPLPEIVIYTVSPPGSKVTFNLGGMTVDLQPSAEVTIANVCGTPGRHYQLYRNIFKTPGGITVYNPAKTTTPCTFATRPPALPACAEASTLDIDCVNSQFP